MNQNVPWPKGYRQIAVLDFVRNRKQLLTVNLAALAVMAVMALLGILFLPIEPSWTFMSEHLWTWPLLAAMYLAYISLHELTHGIPMRILSGVRPKYGFKLCYAYAGSDVWFDRRSHCLIALMPLIVWTIALAALQAALPEGWQWMFYILQISNVSGSAGDVYCVVRLWRMPKEILIQDTGTRMRIVAPRPKDEESK